ncbi:MAG: hypothetical protein QM777_18245 [Pseudorhodoferax sp.]
MTEPQVWTLIAVFTTLMLGTMTIISTMFVRVMRSELGRLEARFDSMDRRFDNLDRDVQALVKHTFGIDRG